MDLSLLLSRIQFGFTIGFHILFPTLNIGLALWIAVMEGLWLRTARRKYLSIARFWTKVFALTFGMGVVSGVVLSYELGTNFGPFIRAAGGVLGPLFGYEVMSAFFLEAGFLGIMLFGWKRVSKEMHYLATVLVCIGTLISAFWIMSANSWMQTPSGFEIVEGKYVVISWFATVFNPSFIMRFVHMLMASYVTTSFFIAGVSAWHVLRKKHLPTARTSLLGALIAASILVPLQIGVGDVVGVHVHHYQPLKTAAIEGLWHTQKGAPLVLFAIPNLVTESNDYVISIPKLASLINTHQWEGELVGLTNVPPADRPIVATVFFAFRVMVGIGLLFLCIAWGGLLLARYQHLYKNRLFLKLCVYAAPLGFVSTIAGWLVAESGRQPWVIYQLMRTSDGASWVPWSHVLTTLILFVLVYGVVFSFYLRFLFRLFKKGPEDVTPPAFLYLTHKENI